MEPFRIGEVVDGRYKITRQIGQGGMGVVVAAWREDLRMEVALKFLQPSLAQNPTSSERFEREGRAASRLRSEHVARVLDVGIFGGAPYIAMEYLVGEDLARVLERRGPLPPAEAVDLLLQVCEAIAEAHTLGIVHRDLKPANLFVTTRLDGSALVKVLDFGISKSTSLDDVSVTASAAVLGSPLYMSPEQLASSRTVDARTDVWSLGVILYQLVTGKTPFSGESFATISAAILRGTYVPPSELCPALPAPLERAIAETLAQDPEGRPSTVAAFAARIAPCGTDAARALCRRIERIAARATTASRPPEGPEGAERVPALAEGPPPSVVSPPPSVVSAMQGDVTRAPGPGQSVDTGEAPAAGQPGDAVPARTPGRSADAVERRPLPTLAKVALGAGGVGLVLAAAVLGLRRGSASPAEPSPSAPAATATDDAGADAADMVTTASAQGAKTPPTPGDAGARWRATPVTLKGFSLGDFAVAAAPSEQHPRGVVAALAFTDWSADQESGVSAVAIDLSDDRILAQNFVGYARPDTATEIARTRRGVVVAQQQKKGLELSWFTEGTVAADSLTVPALAAKKDQDLRAFTTFEDRIVLATGGGGTTTVWILDEHGHLLTSHACHGRLFAPGPAKLVQMGDDAVVANFVTEEPDRVPVCAGKLHGPPRWREVMLHDGRLEVGVGGVYFSRYGGADKAWTRALDENLQPTGLSPPATIPVSNAECSGLTGTIRRRAEEVGGLLVVDMEACCGDTGGGLFVGRPPEKEK